MTSQAARTIAAAVTVCLALGACGGSQKTPEIRYVTPTPEVTPEVTPEITPEVTPEITPEVTPEITPEVTPEITPEVTPEITPEVTPEPTPAPTPAPTPVATLDHTQCSRTAANDSWFQGVADHVSWDVYCALLPTGWSVVAGNADYNNGGTMSMSYKSGTTKTFSLAEGNLCPPPLGCPLAGTHIGPGSFASAPAELYQLPDGSYLMWAHVSSTLEYWAQSTGISEATFKSFCADLELVP
jgi:hypothetical protein